ncbi:portal protein [Arthrobacter phage GantcherGoblin]|nr:portal protein [Arthrobacter phage GantcherGoblin]
MGFGDVLKHAWNAFSERDNKPRSPFENLGNSYGMRPDRRRLSTINDKSILSTIYTRIANDVASISIKHVRLDQNERYSETMNTDLNECLTLQANIDQSARAFRQDMVESLLDKGVIAIVPVDTSLDPTKTAGYDIQTLRVGEVVQWFPKHVRVLVYNETKGEREEVTLPKKFVAVVENPFYNVMNEPNSTLQRLRRKLSLLDFIDEQAGSGKLDLIIQLPYVIKSEARKQQANQRRTDIEEQLKNGKYGIAYTDGTEKITQLNRPAENNMLKQIEMLTAQLHSELGLTPEVFNGSASEQVMLNYHNRTIEPILTSITEAMKRTFLTKTARTQLQSIEFFRDPFKLVPVSSIADIADKFTRNEILSSNEVRGIIGFKPSSDPKAEELRNSNMPQPDQMGTSADPAVADTSEQDAIVNDTLDELERQADSIISESATL